MTRRPVEVVVIRNGQRGPLHLAIPTAPAHWLAACGRKVASSRVTVWKAEHGGDVWGELRTCSECFELGVRALDTVHLARLAGWMR